MTLGCTAATLTACGGGGSSSSGAVASAPAAKTTPAKIHVTIYLAGDSTNWGVDIDNAATNPQQAPGVGNGIVGRAIPSPAQLMQTDFDKALGAGIVTIIDGSIPGATLPSDLNGTAPSIAPLATRLSQLSPPADIVITNSEINDQYVLGENAGIFTSYAQQWVQTVKAVGAVPVYEEPNPICRSDMNINDPNTGTNALVYNIGQTFRSAGGYVLPSLAAFENYTAAPNPQPWNIAFMSSDCVHPNEAGYAFKEANYFPELLSIVKKLLGQ